MHVYLARRMVVNVRILHLLFGQAKHGMYALDVRHVPFVDDTTFHVHQVHVLTMIRRKESVPRTALVRLMQEQTRLLLHDGAFLPMF